MCFGSPAQPSETVENDSTPPPTPAPQAPAPTPSADQDKSPEQQASANPGGTGYGSLIIPRTAFSAVSRANPTG